jgi:3-isopropylmalate dehydratase small subunit
VIAPSFGDIFRTNSVKTGLAPIELSADAYAQVRDALEQRRELTVDLERLVVEHPDGLSVAFDFDAHDRETLLHGLDDIARTLAQADEIAAYEARTTARLDTRAFA